MDTVVKMTVVTVLLLGLAQGSAELQQTCEYKAVGESTLIPLQSPSSSKPLCVMERVSKPSVSHKCSEDAVILTCNTRKSETDVTFEWSLNGRKIEGKVEKTFTVNGRPKPSDKYSCTARNKVGEEKSNDATIQCVDVQVSASVTRPNGDVREGDKVTILCNSSLPADTYFLWLPKNSSPRMQHKNGEFRLENVEVDDSGIYTCQPQWLSAFSHSSQETTVMATEGMMSTITVLLFTTFTQGLHGVNLYHMEWINATVGQSVSLPCMKEENHNYSITQIEWKKSVDHQEHKIVVFNPLFETPYKYWANISLQLEGSGKNLRGSTLKLQSIGILDSGRYVCELTNYPYGTLTAVTHLRVIDSTSCSKHPDVQMSVSVTWPNGDVREGDEVTIFCNSTHPTDTYFLWLPKKNSSRMESKDGEFRLKRVMVDDSGLYTCQVEWLSAEA
ncbi:hypothetical protein MATL_G00048950 [Megalops atlanticus]|uniref:Ig-like domain-containing protein n=1 Tax=Megalops atlanticus TaxID=7932 RepID=A0A9D3QDN4_MEGAT|nr:hypothetical protein MATL_G00048950 [Megalops atlanticus]